MEIFLLCITVIIMARYAGNRRVSPLLVAAHTLLFVILFFSLFFTSDFVPIQYMSQKFFGRETYFYIRNLIYTPCIFGWSANIVLCLVEIILLAVVAVDITLYVIKKFKQYKKPLDISPAADPVVIVPPADFLGAGKLLFLKYCRLLN